MCGLCSSRCATRRQKAASMRANFVSLTLKYTIHRSSCLGTGENSFRRRSCPMTRGNWGGGEDMGDSMVLLLLLLLLIN